MNEDMFSLKGKTAIVTGASMGLGKSMAMALAGQGASVVVADINRAEGEKTVQEIAAQGARALYAQIDVRDQNDIDSTIRLCLDTFHSIDILVNNAGIGRPCPSLEVTREDWRDVIDINLSGVFFVAQSVGKIMVQQGYGNIINISSMSALIVNQSVAQSSYYASKAGVVMITKSLAAEWAPYGIRVNSIAPGVMLTDQTNYMFKDPSKKEQVARWMSYTPMGRAGNPAEIGGAVVYLASDASSFMTGHVLVMDGGYTVY